MDRPDFVIRLIKYYKNINFLGEIFIGDSSSIANHKLLFNMIKKINYPKIKYFYLPNQNIEICQQSLAKKVNSDFIVFSGDDDFFIPSGLEKCINFLGQNSEYSVCHGNSFIFNLKDNLLSGRINYLANYTLKKVSEDDSYERFNNILNDYWVSIFSVHRTDEFLLDLELMKNIKLEFFREKVLSMSSIIRGKSKLLDTNYLYRQVHNKRYSNPKINKLVLDDNFNIDLELCSNLLTKYILKYGGKTTSLIIKNSFKKQLSKDIYNRSIAYNEYLELNKKNSFLKKINIKKFISFLFKKNDIHQMNKEKIFDFLKKYKYEHKKT